MKTVIRRALAMPFSLTKQQIFKYVTIQFVLEQGTKIKHAVTNPVNNIVEIIYDESLPKNWLDENLQDFEFIINNENFVVSIYESLGVMFAHLWVCFKYDCFVIG